MQIFQKKEVTTEIKIDFLSKISLVLFGTFMTSVIFSTLIKILDTKGIWIGLIICVGLVFCGFRYAKKGSKTRLITWGMLVTTILGIIAFIITLTTLSNLLESFTQ